MKTYKYFSSKTHKFKPTKSTIIWRQKQKKVTNQLTKALKNYVEFHEKTS